MDKQFVMVIEKDQKEFLNKVRMCEALGYEVFPKEIDDFVILQEAIERFLSKNSPDQFLNANKVVIQTYLDEYRELCTGQPLFMIRLELSDTNPAVNGFNFFRHFLREENVIFTSIPALGFVNLRTVIFQLSETSSAINFVLQGQGFEKRLRKHLHHHFELTVM